MHTKAGLANTTSGNGTDEDESEDKDELIEALVWATSPRATPMPIHMLSCSVSLCPRRWLWRSPQLRSD